MGNFMDSIVNQRFKNVFTSLEENTKIKNKSDLAKRLGTYNHVINDILNGKRNLTVDQINLLVSLFDINANYLFGHSEQMYLADIEADIPTMSITEKIMGGRNNITLVPQKAMAGYAIGIDNPNAESFTDDFQRFSIPGIEGNLLAFEISGDSMLPHITDGDLVICEPIEREGHQLRLKDNSVYVIVRDDIVAKRIQQVKEDGQLSRLRLISDNKDFYPPYEVELDEVKQILRVKCRLTNHGIA